MQSYPIVQNPISSQTFKLAKDLLQILGGALFLSLASQITIPLSPVPLTMQTFAVMVLALTLGRVKGTLAVVAYLVETMFGLPVLANAASSPFAIVGIRGGYLFGFIVQCYLAGVVFEKASSKAISYGTLLVSLLMISALQMFLGALWLSSFIGLGQALMAGFVPFIPGEFLKCVFVLGLFKKKTV